MNIDIFQGQTTEWLYEQLKIAQQDLAEGKILTSYSGGDVSGSETIVMSPYQRIRLILYALKARGENVELLPTNRARPKFI